MESYLNQISRERGVKADFIGRITGVPVTTDREETVGMLEPYHAATVDALGFDWGDCWRAEQVHGASIAVVNAGGMATTIEGVDGLLTKDAGILLGIYVADCGAVYLFDKKTRALGLLHSGKKGTELEILPKALRVMNKEFGTEPEDVLVALAPCIRPPAYDVDFAAEIREQALAAGVLPENYTDSEVCTSSDLDLYYSYRVEKGATGRMLALLGKEA